MRDARRARRLSLGEELSLMFLHRAGVRHPSRKFVAPNRYQEDKPSIYISAGIKQSHNACFQWGRRVSECIRWKAWLKVFFDFFSMPHPQYVYFVVTY